MKSIKEIMREIKNEFKNIKDNYYSFSLVGNEALDFIEEIDTEEIYKIYIDFEEFDKESTIDYFNESDDLEKLEIVYNEDYIEDMTINDLHSYIQNKYNNIERKKVIKYLVKDYFINNQENIYDEIATINSYNYNIYIICKLFIEEIIKYEDIFEEKTINNLEFILNFSQENADSLEESENIKSALNIIDAIKNDCLDSFENNEIFYDNLLSNYSIKEDINEAVYIRHLKEINPNNYKDLSLNDYANIFLKDIYDDLIYENDEDTTLETLDRILNEEVEIKDNYYDAYKDKFLSHYDRKILFLKMKLNAVINFYLVRKKLGIIDFKEQAIIEQIEKCKNDYKILIYIFDSEYELSKLILKGCMDYYRYTPSKTLNDEKLINNIDLNYIENISTNSIKKIHRTIIRLYNTFKDEVIINTDSFNKLYNLLNNKDVLINIYTNESNKKSTHDLDSVLKYIKNNNNNVKIGIKFLSGFDLNDFIINYILCNNNITDLEKEIFIERMCDNYIKYLDFIKDDDITVNEIINTLESNQKSTWVKIFLRNENIRGEVFSNYLDYIYDMNEKMEIKTNKDIYINNNYILANDIFRSILNDIINGLKNYPISLNNEELSNIIYNYLCDIISIKEDFYKNHLINEYNEDYIKNILKSIIIGDYYKVLKSKDLEKNENQYINMIESVEKGVELMDIFNSNKSFALKSIKSYLKNMNKEKIETDSKTDKVLSKIEAFYYKK